MTTDSRFEKALAGALSSASSVDPPDGFATQVIAALPPVHKPVAAPSFGAFWEWAVGGAVAAVGGAWAIWSVRDVWQGWFAKVGVAASFDLTTLATAANLSLTSGGASQFATVAVLFLIGIAAWGATAIADPVRS